MDIGALTIKLILLALPGLLASRVYRKLKGRRPRQRWEDFVEVLIFASLSYLSLWALWEAAWLCAWPVWVLLALTNWHPTPLEWLGPADPSVLTAVTNSDHPIRWVEVGLTVPLGIGWGVVAAWLEKKEAIRLLGHRWGIASGSGDAEEWLAFNNSPELYKAWVFVVDHKANLVYRAGIDAFSRWANERGEYELVLEDVTAYAPPKEGQDRVIEVGRYDKVYLCRKSEDLTIRLPERPPGMGNLFDGAGSCVDNKQVTDQAKG